MNPATSYSITDENGISPLARIDAEDEQYVQALREYLETNGCRVVINENARHPVAYHIAAGDIVFVKHIFSDDPYPDARRLGIVMGAGAHDAKKLSSNNTKIIVMDPVHLSPADVVDLFSFFFSNDSIFFDKRRNVHEPSSPTDRPVVPQRVPYVPAPPPPESAGETPPPNQDSKRIDTLITDVYKEEIQAIHQRVTKSHRRGGKKIRTGLVAILFFIFLTIILPSLWYAGSVTAIGISFGSAARSLKDGNVTGATRWQRIGDYWLIQSKFIFGVASLPFRLLGQTAGVRGQERLLSFFTDVSAAYKEIHIIIRTGADVSSLLLTPNNSGDGGTPALALERLGMSVTSVQSSLGLAQAQLVTLLRDETFPFNLPFVHSYGRAAEESLLSIRNLLTFAQHILTIYPHLAGFTEPKTYLVLLQNSNELRPTGGFIGSVATAKFENGFLSDFSIQDVYALDGQLKGHVDPPKPIAELLAQEHWYLRDSNWDPDFKVSGERASWFYEKESGTRVDGVIAINVPVLVDLLAATGPINLPDYKDRITAENFFGKSVFYTQADFFPGSTQKSDFLGTLSRALIGTITSDRDINPAALFRSLTAGVSRRDILFMFHDEDLQQLVEHFGWSGSVSTEMGCEGVDGQFCLFDPIATAEANMSVSKVNYFIKRESTREVVIAPDGHITETVSVNFRNTFSDASAASAPGVGGGYQMYLRFLLPSDSLASDVTIDGAPVPSRDEKSKTLPSLPYIEKTESPPGWQAVGVAFGVAPGMARRVRISYTRRTILPFGRGGAYLDLLWYKHPGVSDTKTTTIVRYPLYWLVSDETRIIGGETNPSFIAKDGQLEYNTTLLRDSFTRLKFTK